jgi:gluconokinase
MHVVVMGVSGAGKSTIGAALADRVGAVFRDADDLHPAANIAKMTAGIPLADEDRGPWLDAVGVALAGHARAVVACSALRRIYRDRLRSTVPGAVFVHLDGDLDDLTARMGSREGHFMPVTLLASQLALLEPLEADELGGTVSIRPPLSEVVDAAAGVVARA